MRFFFGNTISLIKQSIRERNFRVAYIMFRNYCERNIGKGVKKEDVLKKKIVTVFTLIKISILADKKFDLI